MALPPESQLYSNKPLEIIWHGRGGQGAWTASEILAKAAIKEGKYIQSFPEFGPERMGAPVKAFTRISDKPIRLHCGVYNPDIVAVIDPTLLKSVNVLEGLKEGGILIVNTKEDPCGLSEIIKKEPWYDKTDLSKYKIYTVNATKISLKYLGTAIVNTAILGAVMRVSGTTNLESLYSVVRNRFRPDVAEKNEKVIEEAYESVRGM